MDEMKSAVDLTHGVGKKLYVTANIFAFMPEETVVVFDECKLLADNLEMLKKEHSERVATFLKSGEAYDFTEGQLSSDVTLLKLLNDEVPHGIYVEVDKFTDRQTTKGAEIYDIEATIYCLRESHKGIIIGKGGSLLKRISTYARQDLERILETKVNLRVWVKVKEDWINNESIVNNKFKLK